jgi:hypothetical protein
VWLRRSGRPTESANDEERGELAARRQFVVNFGAEVGIHRYGVPLHADPGGVKV